MRQLKFITNDPKIVAWHKLIIPLKEASQNNAVSIEEQEKLLASIRKGNKQAIAKLVESSESMIYSVMGQYPTDKFTVGELFEVGKATLIRLASLELNSELREKYFRFGAWYLRQAFIKKINYIL